MIRIIHAFLDSAREMPTNLCVLYFTMIEVGEMNLVWVRSVVIYVVNVGSKFITSRKKKKKNLLVIN